MSFSKIYTGLLQNSKHLLSVVSRPDIVMERGEGCYLYDSENRRYLDFVGGWATNVLGHCHPVMEKVISKQSSRLINCSPAYYNRPMLEYAKRLTEASRMDRVFFGSSGAEVNESAVKLARKYGKLYKNGAYEIISLKNGFHGRTLATMSLTGKEQWKNLFEPKVPGFIHVPINDLQAVKQNLSDRTCAVFVELIQGEGGVYALDQSYVEELKALSKSHKFLLVFDEIQTGMGRTGKLFAYEHYKGKDGNPILPDILTLGKGIGGGYPLAAMLTKEDFDIFSLGDNGGTYTGQPLAMAVGKAILDEMILLRLWEKAEKYGQLIQSRLTELSKNQPKKFPITNVRGKGLLLAFTWNDPQVLQSDAIQLSQSCLENGLIVNALNQSNLRLMPPLVITNQEINQFFDIFEMVCQKIK